MSSHPITLNQLFEGKLYASTELPWYYTIKYIFISYPVFVLVGLLVFPVTLYSNRKKVNLIAIFTILFPWLFVVFWMSLKNSNVYGGIRHITFIYPLAVITAVTVFTLVYRKIREKKKRSLVYVFIGAMALLIWHPLVHMVKNHRYSYIYFNEFAGGIKNAYAKYEFDYFFHSMREATEWVIKEIKRNSDFEKDHIAWVATNYKKLTSYYLRNHPNIKARYVEYQKRGEYDWDYAIFVNTYIYPHQLLNHTYPPKNTVHTIEVNNKPICAVLKRKHFYDLKAHKLSQSGNIRGAINYLQKAIKADPNYEWAWANLMGCYFYTNQYHKALKAGNQFLRCNGDDEQALKHIAIAYLKTNQVEQSILTLKKLLKLDKNDPVALYYMGIAYDLKKDYNQALKYLKRSAQLLPDKKRPYQAIIDIYRKQGNEEMARQYYNLAK